MRLDSTLTGRNGTCLFRRNGFTLIELLISVSIVAVLIGLTVPSINRVRESARTTQCANNLRSIALAVLAFENSKRHFPSPTLNSPVVPKSRDIGLFPQILPWIEEGNVATKFSNKASSVSLVNQGAIDKMPSLFLCPSSPEKLGSLSGCADVFSGPAIPSLTSPMCDYAANGGYWGFETENQRRSRVGAINVVIAGRSRPSKSRDVRDGLSNTMLLWESSSSFLKVAGYHRELSFDFAGARTFSVRVADDLELVESVGLPSSKSYLYSWAGLRTSSLVGYDLYGQISDPMFNDGNISLINVSNDISQPFSQHPLICNFAFVDGSVHAINEDVDASLAIGLSTRSGGEAISISQ